MFLQLKEALLLALWRRDRGGVGDSSAASEFAESEASAQESGGTVAENTASGGRGRGSRGLGAEVHVSLLSAGVSALANQASGFLQVHFFFNVRRSYGLCVLITPTFCDTCAQRRWAAARPWPRRRWARCLLGLAPSTPTSHRLARCFRRQMESR